VVGYYVGKSWNLPGYLCEAIHEHHSIEKTFQDETSDPTKRTLLAILKMAEHICRSYHTLGNQTVDYEWQRIEDLILVYVGMSQYDFTTLEQQIHEMGLGAGDYYF